MGPLAVGSVEDLKACIVNIIAFMMIRTRIPGSVYLDDNQQSESKKARDWRRTDEREI